MMFFFLFPFSFSSPISNNLTVTSTTSARTPTTAAHKPLPPSSCSSSSLFSTKTHMPFFYVSPYTVFVERFGSLLKPSTMAAIDDAHNEARRFMARKEDHVAHRPSTLIKPAYPTTTPTVYPNIRPPPTRTSSGRKSEGIFLHLPELGFGILGVGTRPPDRCAALSKIYNYLVVF